MVFSYRNAVRRLNSTVSRNFTAFDFLRSIMQVVELNYENGVVGCKTKSKVSP